MTGKSVLVNRNQYTSINGAIALSSPPPPPSIVIDDSLKNAAESFTVALALTLEGG